MALRVAVAAPPWIKKGARLTPRIVSKKFLLDKVKGPGI